MRLAYLDESGISTQKQEPFLVVAGVIIHGDKQLAAVEDHLTNIIKDHFPDENSSTFFLRATDLFSGGKYRDIISFDERLEILDELAGIPTKFGLRISYAALEKAKFPKHFLGPKTKKKEIDILQHASAFFNCSIGIEVFMRATTKDENAMIVAEKRPEVESAIRAIHRVMKDPELMKAAEVKEDDWPFVKLLPFERIRDVPHFANKRESKLLQLADLAAFAIQRYLSKKKHSERLYNPLKKCFIWPPIFLKGFPRENELSSKQINRKDS